MKVYNHKDAYDHLKYLFLTQKEDCFIATIDEVVVHYGEDGGFDLERAQALNLPIYDLRKKGGAMVTSPGDIVYCFLFKEPSSKINTELRKFLAQKLAKCNIQTTIIDNDLLVNNKKCFGFMSNQIGNLSFVGGHISINCDLELIRQLCTKPMEKIPGGLGEYGISTQQVVDWLNEFWFYYKK